MRTRLYAALWLSVAVCTAISAQNLQPLQFDPAHQPRVTLATPDIRAEVVAQPPDPRTGASRLIYLKTGVSESRIVLPFEFYQVNSIISGPGKLIVIGMQGGTIYEIGIIDITSARLVDYFTCYSPAASDDGHYVAFTKFYGPHSSPSPDDHSLLYVVARSPSDNRPVGIALEDHENVGYAVYPPGIGNWRSDNINVPTDVAHHLASYYLWKEPGSYFFASRSANEFRVVWVALNGSIISVRDVVIPPSELPGQQSGFLPRLLNLSLERDHATLTVMCTTQRTIHVNLSRFISVESIDLSKPPFGGKR